MQTVTNSLTIHLISWNCLVYQPANVAMTSINATFVI